MDFSSQIIEFIETFLKKFDSQFSKIWIHPSVSIKSEFLQTFDPFKTPKSPPKLDETQIVNAIVDYQLGAGSHQILDNIPLQIERSRKTGILRRFSDDSGLLGTFRASDFVIVPSPRFAQKLHQFLPFPKMRVVASDEAAPFVRQNKDLLTKFVVKADPAIRCGEEVLVVDEKDSFLNYGKSVLAVPEMRDFDRGVAVKIRR